MNVLPDTDDRTIVSSFFWTQHRNVTDRQTVLQWILQRSALRAMRNADAL